MPSVDVLFAVRLPLVTLVKNVFVPVKAPPLIPVTAKTALPLLPEVVSAVEEP